MRRNILAASALLLWGASLNATAVAQQPVKLGVLNDQTGLYSDLSGMGSVHASRMAVEDFGGKVLGRPIPSFTISVQAKGLNEESEAAMTARHVGSKSIVLNYGDADVRERVRGEQLPALDPRIRLAWRAA